MPVRLLTQSVLRWPEPEQVLREVRDWAEEQAGRVPALQRRKPLCWQSPWLR